jgi:hypothetical protein
VIVHRVLTYSLELEEWKNSPAGQSAHSAKHRPRPPPSLAPDEVAKIAETCNTRKANAKKAQEASSKIYLCDYLLRKHASSPLSAGGVIIDMFSVIGNADPSFEILIPHLGIEKKIHLTDLLKQGKILAGSIEPKDAPEVGKTTAGGAGGAGQQKNNRQERRQEKQTTQSSSSSTVVPVVVSASAPPAAASPSTPTLPSAAPGSTAPILKSAKRLMITWLDGTSNVYSIFDAIDVELMVRRGPPMELDAFVISPTIAAEREAQKLAGDNIDPTAVGGVAAVIEPASPLSPSPDTAPESD